jgi:putative effector of murein hydrolase
MLDKFINHITSREFLFNLKLLLLSLSIFLYIIGNKISNKVKRYFIKILFFLTFYVLIIPLLKR